MRNKPRSKYEILIFALNKSVASRATFVNLALALWRNAAVAATLLDAKLTMKLICWESTTTTQVIYRIGHSAGGAGGDSAVILHLLYGGPRLCVLSAVVAICLRCSAACGMAVMLDGRDYNER